MPQTIDRNEAAMTTPPTELTEDFVCTELEIVIGAIQEKHIGKDTFRKSVIGVLREILSLLRESKTTPKDAYVQAGNLVSLLMKSGQPT